MKLLRKKVATLKHKTALPAQNKQQLSVVRGKWLRVLTYIFLALLVLTTATVLAATFRGKPTADGTGIYYQTQAEWLTEVLSPFESSNTSSRYALVDAIVNNHSLNLNLQQARFAAPDAVYINDRFSSIFTPGVAFIAAPFYWLGQQFGMAQVFTFTSTILFACLNGLLIYVLARKMHVGVYASVFGSAVFLLASNGLAYAHSLTQHHLSTLMILSALLLATHKPGIVRNLLFGAALGIALLCDIPNVFLLLPVGLFVVWQHFTAAQIGTKTAVSVNLRILVIAIGIVPFFAAFLAYNQNTLGSPFTYAQMFMRTDYFDSEEKKAEHLEGLKNIDPYEDKLPLGTRQQLNSTYILLLSDERSWLYYSPIILIGVLGLIAALRQTSDSATKTLAVLFAATILMNIVVYSMFGDPWGGWSFGPRYLIPAAAILSVLVAYSFEMWKSKKLFVVLCILLAVYSTAVSVLGSVTTLTIPPKVEADQLQNYIPHTYQYNLNLLTAGKSSSLLFNSLLHRYMSAYQYWILVSALSSTVLITLILRSSIEGKRS